jgi:hypothetical protein
MRVSYSCSLSPHTHTFFSFLVLCLRAKKKIDDLEKRGHAVPQHSAASSATAIVSVEECVSLYFGVLADFVHHRNVTLSAVEVGCRPQHAFFVAANKLANHAATDEASVDDQRCHQVAKVAHHDRGRRHGFASKRGTKKKRNTSKRKKKIRKSFFFRNKQQVRSLMFLFLFLKFFRLGVAAVQELLDRCGELHPNFLRALLQTLIFDYTLWHGQRGHGPRQPPAGTGAAAVRPTRRVLPPALRHTARPRRSRAQPPVPKKKKKKKVENPQNKHGMGKTRKKRNGKIK